MPKASPTTEALRVTRDLAQAMEAAGLTTAEVTVDGITVKLVRLAESSRVVLRSPAAGVYYPSPGPDEPPYAEPGLRLEPGAPFAVIDASTEEATPDFREARAEVGGVVECLHLRPGDRVALGTPVLTLTGD